MRTKKPDHATPCDGGIALDEPAAAAAAATPPRLNDWPTRQCVRQLSRELRRPTSVAIGAAPTIQGLRHFDPPHNVFEAVTPSAASPFPAVAPQSAVSAVPRSRQSDVGQVAAWLIVLAGTLLLATGIGLVAWSLTVKQLLYWNLALGLTLGGQGTLIFGLVLVVSRLWRNSRYAALKLQDVHARLSQLQNTAEALATMRAGGGPAFYADLVRGASPHVLLANLKGQLDQLAARVGTRW
jgi:hypothetical protein